MLESAVVFFLTIAGVVSSFPQIDTYGFRINFIPEKHTKPSVPLALHTLSLSIRLHIAFKKLPNETLFCVSTI